MSETGCSRETTPELVEKVLKYWAVVQKESINFVDDLLRSGVRAMGPKELKDHLKEITGDVDWYNAEMRDAKERNLEQFDMDLYQSKVMGYVEKLLDEIGHLNLPLTLVHGDMNPRNIIKRGNGEFTFFDWEGPLVSYPFLDALSFSCVTNDYEDVNAEDLAVYFDEWGEHADSKRLVNALKAKVAYEYLISTCYGYDTWKQTEECRRLFAMKEMEDSLLSRLEKSLS